MLSLHAATMHVTVHYVCFWMTYVEPHSGWDHADSRDVTCRSVRTIARF